MSHSSSILGEAGARDSWLGQMADAADQSESQIPSLKSHAVISSPPVRNRPANAKPLGIDADYLETLHTSIAKPALHGVYRAQTGQPLWRDIYSDLVGDEKTGTPSIDRQLSMDLERLRQTYLFNVLYQWGQQHNGYIMMHSHKKTHVSSQEPYLGCVGPFPKKRAQAIQKVLKDYHKKKAKQLKEAPGPDQADYAYFIPHFVEAGQFYPMIQYDPPAMTNLVKEQELQQDPNSLFQQEYTDLALSGLAYCMRRTIAHYSILWVRKVMMFNIEDQLPSVYANSIHQTREDEQEQFEVFCQYSGIRSGEEYAALHHLVTSATNGAEVRTRLQNLFLSREERERQQKNEKEKKEEKQNEKGDDEGTHDQKKDEKQATNKDAESNNEDQDKENTEDEKGDENDTEKREQKGNADDDKDEEEEEEKEDDEEYDASQWQDEGMDKWDIDDMLWEQDKPETEEEQSTESTTEDNAPQKDTGDNRENMEGMVSASYDDSSLGDSNRTVVQRTPIPDDVPDVPSSNQLQLFTASMYLDNYSVMQKIMDMFHVWEDIREHFATVLRRPYIVHYVLSAYLFHDVLEGDLEKWTDEELWTKANDVFYRRDPNLQGEDGGRQHLQKYVDKVAEKAETTFYKNYKREEALLTCEEWTAFFNQFDFDELVEGMIERHNARASQKQQISLLRRRKGGSSSKQSGEERNVELGNVQTHVKKEGLHHLIEEDPDLPTLNDLLEGRYTFDPEEAPYDVHFLKATPEGRHLKKNRVTTKEEDEEKKGSSKSSTSKLDAAAAAPSNSRVEQVDPNDEDENDEPPPQTREELIQQKTRNLFVALTKDPDSGYSETFRTVMLTIMDCILLGPHANGLYTPPPPRKSRRSFGYTAAYFRKALKETVERLIPRLVLQSRAMYKAQRNKFVQEHLASSSRAPTREMLAHQHYRGFSEACDEIMREAFSNNECMVFPLVGQRSPDPDRLEQSVQRLVYQQHPWLQIFRIPSAVPSDCFNNMVKNFMKHTVEDSSKKQKQQGSGGPGAAYEKTQRLMKETNPSAQQ